jgi:hypothetical protein
MNRIATTMNMRNGISFMSAGILLITATLTLAHHSFAMYDNENQVKFVGQVAHFQWTNPHVYIGSST